jgi:hypothetical protein
MGQIEICTYTPRERLQQAESCSQLAGTAKDCVLTRLLSNRLKDDGVTFEDEVSLRDTMAGAYLGTSFLRSGPISCIGERERQLA